jgi:hypothetical protein
MCTASFKMILLLQSNLRKRYHIMTAQIPNIRLILGFRKPKTPILLLLYKENTSKCLDFISK